MEPFLIPLREKYRVRPFSKGGKTKPRTGNTHGPRRHGMKYYLNQQVRKRSK